MSTAPPQDRDAERALLACLLTGHPVIDDVADLLQGRDFYDPRHETIWDACHQVRATGGRVDPITLPVPAEAKPFVMQLVAGDLVSVPAQAPVYAEKILAAALRRRLQDAGTQVVQLALSTEDATKAAEDAQQIIAEAAAQARHETHGVLAGDAMADALDWLEKPVAGVPTPWPDLDRITHGMHDGQLIVIGARPGVGKSVVAKDLAVTTARRGVPVHLATLEMSRNDYLARIIAGIGGVDLGRMIARQMSEGDWAKVNDTYSKVAGLPLFIDDRAGQSMAQIRAGARATKRRLGGLGLIVVDYLQLVTPRDLRLPRQEQVSEMSRASKLLAKEMGCPVVMLAQLNRGSTERGDKRPVLTDLRESGSLEQDADQVWLLHRPDLVGDEDHLGEIHVLVPKNRNGAAGATAELSFQGHYARVVSMV